MDYPGRDRVIELVNEHPELIVALAAALIALNVISLYRSVALLHEGRQLVGLKQLARSEALGG